jgi:hypothetical protein
MGWALFSVAWASEPVEVSADSSAGVLMVLLGLLAGAYLVAHWLVDWLQRRFLLITGFEYVLLGALLGPVLLPSVAVLGDVPRLGAVVAFAAGWVGLLYGMELDLKALLTGPDRALRLSLLDSAISGAVVAGASWLFFQYFPLQEAPSQERMAFCSLLLGFACAAGSSSPIELVAQRYPTLKSELLPLLQRSIRFGNLLAIGGFGLLFCIYHEGTSALPTPPRASDWVLLTLGLGLSLGALFSVFLADEDEANPRFLALTGIIVFASGAAMFLNLSALTTNLLLGAFLINTRQGGAARATLTATARPVNLLLLVFAGSLWQNVPALPAITLTVLVILARGVGKWLGGRLTAYGTLLRHDLHRGLLSQGEAAVAMAVSVRLVYDGPGIDLAYAAILTSALFFELIAPRWLRGLLADAGELQDDLPAALPLPKEA